MAFRSFTLNHHIAGFQMRTHVVLALALCTLGLRAQLLAPFTASDGISTVIRTATQAGITNAVTDAIYTSGDTSLLSNLGGAIGSAVTLSFDFQRGTNTLWLYSMRGKTNTGRDTTLIYAVIKLVALYQAFPLFGIPGLDMLGQLSGEQALPATFMNSNIMVRKLASDSTFLAYRQRYPRSILHGASLASVRTSPTSQPSPLWSVLIAEGSLFQPASPLLTCFVPADDTSGTARCITVPFSNTEQLTQPTHLELYPNPASDLVAVRLPYEALRNNAELAIYTCDGRCVLEYHLTNPAAGQAIAVPVSSLAQGFYMLVYRTANAVLRTPLAIVR